MVFGHARSRHLSHRHKNELVTKTCVNSSRKRAEKPCGMQLHFLRKSNIGQTNVTRFFSSRAPLPWLNSDSFPPRPMIFISSGKVRSTTATSNSRFINHNFLQEPIVLVWVRSRAKSIRLLHPKRTRAQGGGTPHMKGVGMLVGNFELDP